MRNLELLSLKRSANSAIAERNSRTKSKRNSTSAIKITQHDANSACFTILVGKRVRNLLMSRQIYFIA